MLRLALVTCSTLFLACAGAEPALSSAQYGTPLNGTSEPAPATPEPPACQVTFTPDAELLGETTTAAERWSAATGCIVQVGEGGIVIALVAEGWTTPSGRHADGSTFATDDTGTQIRIEIAAQHRARSLPHEMGHALRFSSEHVEDNASALMFHDGGLGRITADDVTYACSGPIACQAFAPEE